MFSRNVKCFLLMCLQKPITTPGVCSEFSLPLSYEAHVRWMGHGCDAGVGGGDLASPVPQNHPPYSTSGATPFHLSLLPLHCPLNIPRTPPTGWLPLRGSGEPPTLRAFHCCGGTGCALQQPCSCTTYRLPSGMPTVRPCQVPELSWHRPAHLASPLPGVPHLPECVAAPRGPFTHVGPPPGPCLPLQNVR